MLPNKPIHRTLSRWLRSCLTYYSQRSIARDWGVMCPESHLNEIARLIKELTEEEFFEEAISLGERSFNESEVKEALQFLADKLRSACIDLASKKMDAGPNYERLEDLLGLTQKLICQADL